MWQGIFPAVTTKFTAGDTLDIAEMERCFALQVEAGVDGLIVCGSLGEAMALEPDEKIEILKTAVTKQIFVITLVSLTKIPIMLSMPMLCLGNICPWAELPK